MTTAGSSRTYVRSAGGRRQVRASLGGAALVALVVLLAGGACAWASRSACSPARTPHRLSSAGVGTVQRRTLDASPSASAPVISWSAPSPNALVAGPVTCSVSASGAPTLSLRVTLDDTATGRALGEATQAAGSEASLSFKFDPAGLAEGTHHLIGSARSDPSSGTTPTTTSPSVSAARRDVRVDLRPPMITSISVAPSAGLFVGKAPGRLKIVVKGSDAVSRALRYAGLIRAAGTGGKPGGKPGVVLMRLAKTGRSGDAVTFAWDGKDAKGKVRPPARYVFEVTATDEVGHRSPTVQKTVKLLSVADVARVFSGAAAKKYATALAAFGVRRAGSANEATGADFVAGRLAAFGYSPKRLRVPLVNGATSQDVFAVNPAASPNARIVIVGAHMDSIDNAGHRGPGANDDASGIGVMLETARALAKVPSTYEIRFVGFGAEEMIDANPDHHHAGSRAYAASLSAATRKRVYGMVNLDMVGVGSHMGIGTQSGAAESFARYHLATAAKLRYAAAFVGHGTGSDHEAFVKLGIPVAYYDFSPDPNYHSAGDTAAHLSAADMAATGRTLFGSLYRLAAK